MDNRLTRIVSVVAILWYVALCLMNLQWGDLNQDEGWYLYTARETAQGRLPFRDFAFTQGPIMPLVYAVASPMVDRYGLAGGRAFTAALGFLALLLSCRLARGATVAGDRMTAGVLTLVLIGVNVYHSYFTTIVKTYALSAVFLVGGLCAVRSAWDERRLGAACLAGVLLSLATCVRISIGIVLPVVALALLLRRTRLGYGPALAFSAAAGATLLVVLLPFALMAPESFWFGMAQYHSERTAGSLFSGLTFKAGFVSRYVQAYFVLVVLWAVLLLLRRRTFEVGEPPSRFDPGFRGLLWLVGLAISLVHLAAPFPYDDYQVFVTPVFAAALSAALAERIPADTAALRWRLPLREGVVVTVLAASLAASLSSPVNQSWFIHGRDRIWWLMKDSSDLARLQEVGRLLREESPPDSFVLTQDIYIAMESGLRVPPGLEMGPFSYYPDWPREKAEKLHVVNREMMEDLITEGSAEWAALSGYSLSIESPAVAPLPDEEREALWDLVRTRYEEVKQVPAFGQAHTTLHLLRRRPASG